MFLAAIKIKRAEIRRDQIGEALIVVGQDVRKCLMCDEIFSRQAACEHAQLLCHPTALRAAQRRSRPPVRLDHLMLGRDRVCDVSGMV